MKKDALDHIDIEILNILQKNASTAIKDIAAHVFLSSPAVSARIERMERQGYILGYHAQVNPAALGYQIKAFISLEIEPVRKKEFYPYIKSCRNVIECNCVIIRCCLKCCSRIPWHWISLSENCRVMEGQRP